MQSILKKLRRRNPVKHKLKNSHVLDVFTGKRKIRRTKEEGEREERSQAGSLNENCQLTVN